MPVFEEYRAGGGLHRQADLRRQTGRADLHVSLVAGKRLVHQCLGTGTSAYIADADDQYPFEHFIGFQSCGAGAWKLGWTGYAATLNSRSGLVIKETFGTS